MEDNLELHNQVEFLYNAAAKPLYNLALYTIGDPVLARQATTDAFTDSFCNISDKTDLELFMNKSTKLLYRYIRKAQKNNSDRALFLNTAEDTKDGRQEKHVDMLRSLSPDERYILLLFCWQRFSVKRLAGAISRPMFIAKKRLYAALNKAADTNRRPQKK